MMPHNQVTIKAPNGREIIIPTGLFINNAWIEPVMNGTLTSINPA
jgi:hypothetical protein